FYGRGAGGLPSATAIVSDVVKAAKNILLGIKGKSTLRQLNEKETMPSDENFSNFYMRIHVQDVTGSFVIISDLFNQARISFLRTRRRWSSFCDSNRVRRGKSCKKHFIRNKRKINFTST